MMPYNNVSRVVEGHLCSGCGTCKSICPANAITMQFSSLGFLHPNVDNDKCILCKKCIKICPGIDIDAELCPGNYGLMGHALSTYVGKSKDKEVYQNAQSGGLVTEFLSYMLDAKEIDAALVVGQENLKAKYIVVSSSKELLNCQLSQYTPVDLNSGLSMIASFQSVAIVGLPCDIEGIIKVRKHNPNLLNNIKYLFGLVCGGTLANAITNVVCKNTQNVERVEWRSKKYSDYKRAKIALISSSWKSPILLNRNIRMAAKHFLTPPRCRICWDKMNVYADIVFADAWGVKNTTEDGETVIIVRSEIGDQLLSKIKYSKRVILKECNISDVEKGQGIIRRLEQVKKTIRIYKENSWPTPGWSDNSIFAQQCEGYAELKKEIENVIRADNLDSNSALELVADRVSSKAKSLFLKDIKDRVKFYILKIFK